MDIAYTMAPGRGDTDLLMLSLAEGLIADGLRPVGTVQINTERADAGPCDMDVRVLPDGPAIRISQSLGRDSKGCRLDPSALETAVALVGTQLARGADCLIVNKFGKHEAEGRGFRSLIAEAASIGLPVIVGLNALNAPAFETFTAGIATGLEPTHEHLRQWLDTAIARRHRAA